VWNCGGDVAAAFKQNCSRTGCHNTLDAFAGLDMTDPSTLRAKMVDQVAMHGDIGCNMPGTPFRACDAAELVALGCPTDAKLIDSANFDNSWVVKKINGAQGECGDPMPISPGNSVTNGWNDTRKACYIEFFRSLIGTQ
jgi:hypothetical protein